MEEIYSASKVEQIHDNLNYSKTHVSAILIRVAQRRLGRHLQYRLFWTAAIYLALAPTRRGIVSVKTGKNEKAISVDRQTDAS